MIAQAGIFSFQMNSTTPLEEATCTQRYAIEILLLQLDIHEEGLISVAGVFTTFTL
jgi:hypothetical protein